MILSKVITQAIIIIAVVLIFFLSVILNWKTKAPKGAELPEKCQFCPSQTCIIKLGDVEKKKEELKEYLDICEEDDDSKEETDYLNWDRYFMSVAYLSSMRSKDPNTQVGACIVNQKQRIVGIGYNGLPFGCDDDLYPWANEGEFLETKYPYIVHAEPNAILNSNSELAGCTIYVTLFPCHECVKLIIQSGIKEIVYLSDKYNNTVSDQAAKRMLNSSGIQYRKIDSFRIRIEDEL